MEYWHSKVITMLFKEGEEKESERGSMYRPNYAISHQTLKSHVNDPNSLFLRKVAASVEIVTALQILKVI